MSSRIKKQNVRDKLELFSDEQLRQHTILLSAQIPVLQRELYLANQLLKWRGRGRKVSNGKSQGASAPANSNGPTDGGYQETV